MDISNEEIILLKNLLLNLTDQIIQYDGESNKMKEWKVRSKDSKDKKAHNQTLKI